MRFRQVHLDFHTGPKIPGIGEKFDKKQFQDALKEGHVDSITVFAKCHHGYSYHPTQVNETHPNLHFDLLKAEIDACHEIGVNAPVYISAGLDEKFAENHHECVARERDESIPWTPDFMHPGYHLLCFNSPYLDLLVKQVEEVCKNYDADGIFLDICYIRPCYCQSCLRDMRQAGIDPEDTPRVWEFAEKVYANYARRMREAVDKYKPGLPLFHNAGHIDHGRRDLAGYNTHIELESLPTGGWGYDHFPLSAGYVRNLGMEYLGMTGKFHQSWGEFGGYKHQNALLYETSLALAFGAGNSVGDQLHPSGKMDMATYKTIGFAYREVEKKEPYVVGAKAVADVALFSEEVGSKPGEKNGKANTGASRILLEGKYLFDVIDAECDFSRYKVIILPDRIQVDTALKEKLDAFLQGGGQLLATGTSGINENGFMFDFGTTWQGENPYRPDYFRPGFEVPEMYPAAYVMYEQGQKLALAGGEELGARENPYFNRTTEHYCSHRQTPCSGEYGGPGMVRGKDGIYIAWNVFTDYATVASLILKKMVLHALDLLLCGKKSIETDLPAQGVVSMTKQAAENRYIVHALFANTVKRGEGIEVIEDLLPVYGTSYKVRVPETIKAVRLVPQGEEIPFQQEDDAVSFALEKLYCHQMVSLEF